MLDNIGLRYMFFSLWTFATLGTTRIACTGANPNAYYIISAVTANSAQARAYRLSYGGAFDGLNIVRVGDIARTGM